MTLGLDPLFKVLTEALVGVAGCLARSDCKERDTLAINQGLPSALKVWRNTPSIPLEGTINNQVIGFTF